MKSAASSPAAWLAALASLVPAPAARTVQPNVLASYPHDTSAFTQGLHYERRTKTLLESTGLYGSSTVRRVEIASGRVLRQVDLEKEYFGEGVSVDDASNTCVQLSWRERLCFVRDASTLEPSRVEPLPQGMREGWGLTSDGKGAFWASDGTSILHELDGASLAVRRRVRVRLPSGGGFGGAMGFGGFPGVGGLGRELNYINDLQWVDGMLWANVWGQERLACIDPTSGIVRGFADLSLLLTPDERRRLSAEDVLNGIAYDPEGGGKGRGCLYVTGKNWPRLFKIAMPSIGG